MQGPYSGRAEVSSSSPGTHLKRRSFDGLYALRRCGRTRYRSSSWPSPKGHDHRLYLPSAGGGVACIGIRGYRDQAIAGLLHGAIEDGGGAYAPKIVAQFWPEVLALVEACSDGTAESKAKATTPATKKADWGQRKEAYLLRVETEDPAALLVTACDKLHNARAIVTDLEQVGLPVFDRFTAGRDGTLWYYAQAEAVLRSRECPVVDTLAAAVTRMRELVVSQCTAGDCRVCPNSYAHGLAA